MAIERIYLVGARASGKTTIAKEVASLLGWTMVDTDELVVAGAGCSIAEIVERKGWDAFRDMESAALNAVSGENQKVIATGGGMVLREENRARMRETGVVFWLDAEPAALVARLCADPLEAQRPSLTGKSLAEEVEEIMREREPLYTDAATEKLDALSSPQQLALHIAKVVGAK